MIHKLSRNDCEKARPIFQCMDHNLAVNSIIEGATPAGIYVDDPVNPKAAITWTKHRFYLAGDAGNNAFNRAVSLLFAEEIYPQFIAAGMYQLVLYYAPDNWEEKKDVILRNKFPLKSRRQFYAISELERDWRALIPAGFTLRRVDRELFADTGLENRHALIEEMQSERPSVEEFLSKSFGFCIVHGEEIVGWCLSEYNSENCCEVGIETVKAYRRRGIATVTALALVEHALANGVTQVGWHCYADNHGSIATARKVGFQKVTDYSTYYACFKEADNLAANGYRCFQQGQYQEAIAWGEKAFEAGDAPTWAYLVTARAYAALGDCDATFEYLNQAVDRGWIDTDAITNAQEFNPLHDTPEWQALLTHLEKEDL